MKKAITILASLFLANLIMAQAYGEIQGKIITQDQKPLGFVSVWVEQGSKIFSASSDMDGKYKIKPLESGSYTLKVSYVGYENQSFIVGVNPDEITFMPDIIMSSTSIVIGEPGKGPTIVGRPLINPEETSKKTIDMDDFKHSPANKSIAGMMLIAAPGVKQAPDGSGLTFKGSRTGSSVYYIDGVKVVGPNVPTIPSSGIKRMSIYTGGVPAKYGDTVGGVVVIETKDYFSEYNKKKYKNL